MYPTARCVRCDNTRLSSPKDLTNDDMCERDMFGVQVKNLPHHASFRGLSVCRYRVDLCGASACMTGVQPQNISVWFLSCRAAFGGVWTCEWACRNWKVIGTHSQKEQMEKSLDPRLPEPQ